MSLGTTGKGLTCSGDAEVAEQTAQCRLHWSKGVDPGVYGWTKAQVHKVEHLHSAMKCLASEVVTTGQRSCVRAADAKATACNLA